MHTFLTSWVNDADEVLLPYLMQESFVWLFSVLEQILGPWEIPVQLVISQVIASSVGASDIHLW